MKEVIKAIFQTSNARVYSLVTSIIALSITARWLGPEGRGLYSTVIAWVSLFSVVGNLTLGNSVVHYATINRDRNWLKEILGNLFFLTTIISIISWLVAFILFFTSQGKIFSSISGVFLILGFINIPFMAWEYYGSSLLISCGKVELYNRATIIGRTIVVILLLLAWFLEFPLEIAFIIFLTSQVIISLGGFLYLYERSDRILSINFNSLREVVRNGLISHPATIGNFILGNSGIIIVNWFCGAAETGYYQLVLQLVNGLLIIPQSSFYIFLSKIAEIGSNAGWKLQRKLIIYIMMIMLGVLLLSSFLGPYVIRIIAGKEFESSIPIFLWSFLLILGMSFSHLMNAQWIGNGLFWQIALITTILSILNIFLQIVLIPKFGAVGAIWGTTVAYFLFVIINFLFYLKRDRDVRKLSYNF